MGDTGITVEKVGTISHLNTKKTNSTSVSASKHSVTDKQHLFCYDISNLFFEVLFMLMCKTAAFRQFI